VNASSSARYGGSGSSAYSSTTPHLHLTAQLRVVAAAVELRVVLELPFAEVAAAARLLGDRGADARRAWTVPTARSPAPTPEDRAEVELVVRIRADFDGRVYLTAGRVAKPGEYCGPAA
jgi:hypothetical protein